MIYEPRHKRLNTPGAPFFLDQGINMSINLLFTRSTFVAIKLKRVATGLLDSETRLEMEGKLALDVSEEEGEEEEEKKGGRKKNWFRCTSCALHNGARVERCGKGHRQGAATFLRSAYDR